jgi:hypothetical protein
MTRERQNRSALGTPKLLRGRADSKDEGALPRCDLSKARGVGRVLPRQRGGRRARASRFKPHRSVFAIRMDPNFGSGVVPELGRAHAGGPSVQHQTARALRKVHCIRAVRAKCPDLPRAVFFGLRPDAPRPLLESAGGLTNLPFTAENRTGRFGLRPPLLRSANRS